MIYLILAFCSSALISIIMRLGEGHIQNNISTLAANYLMCLLLSLVYSARSGSVIVPAESGRVAIVLGLISGFFYFGSFALYQYNIFRNGVLMSAAFMKLGVLVPTMLAVIAFGERPGALQIIGICLALSAIVLVNAADGSGSEKDTLTAPKALILLLLVGGSGDAMSKIYEELGPAEHNSQYLLYTFASALIICTLAAALKGQRIAAPDIIFGSLVGIPNYYSARFLLLSLYDVPAVIAYPVFSVGTILVVGLAGALIFHERLTRSQVTAVAIIALAMILLNI